MIRAGICTCMCVCAYVFVYATVCMKEVYMHICICLWLVYEAAVSMKELDACMHARMHACMFSYAVLV